MEAGTGKSSSLLGLNMEWMHAPRGHRNPVSPFLLPPPCRGFMLQLQPAGEGVGEGASSKAVQDATHM